VLQYGVSVDGGEVLDAASDSMQDMSPVGFIRQNTSESLVVRIGWRDSGRGSLVDPGHIRRWEPPELLHTSRWGPWYLGGSRSISPRTSVEATSDNLPATCSRIRAANAGIRGRDTHHAYEPRPSGSPRRVHPEVIPCDIGGWRHGCNIT